MKTSVSDCLKRWSRSRGLRAGVALLCFVALSVMIHRVGVRPLVDTLVAHWPTLFVACLVWLGVYLLNTLSFATLVWGGRTEGGQRVSFRTLFRLTVAGYALNYITPFGLLGGEPYRIAQLSKYTSTREATFSVGLYATMHVASHCLLWVWAAVVARPQATTLSTSTFAGIAALFVAMIGTAVWCSRRRAIPLTTTLVALLLEWSARVVGVAEYALLLSAVGFPITGARSALWVVSFSSLLANILFFAPLQIGTREGSILLALQALQPDAMSEALLPFALAISLATRIRELGWIVVGLTFIFYKGKRIIV